jgi:hypothetical protein
VDCPGFFFVAVNVPTDIFESLLIAVKSLLPARQAYRSEHIAKLRNC